MNGIFQGMYCALFFENVICVLLLKDYRYEVLTLSCVVDMFKMSIQ